MLPLVPGSENEENPDETNGVSRPETPKSSKTGSKTESEEHPYQNACTIHTAPTVDEYPNDMEDSNTMQYEPEPTNPLMPEPYITSSQTVEKTSTDYIDTSLPFTYPTTYETIDQIKYKINKEIQLERTASPIGMDFIVFA